MLLPNNVSVNRERAAKELADSMERVRLLKERIKNDTAALAAAEYALADAQRVFAGAYWS